MTPPRIWPRIAAVSSPSPPAALAPAGPAAGPSRRSPTWRAGTPRWPAAAPAGPARRPPAGRCAAAAAGRVEVPLRLGEAGPCRLADAWPARRDERGGAVELGGGGADRRVGRRLQPVARRLRRRARRPAPRRRAGAPRSRAGAPRPGRRAGPSPPHGRRRGASPPRRSARDPGVGRARVRAAVRGIARGPGRASASSAGRRRSASATLAATSGSIASSSRLAPVSPPAPRAWRPRRPSGRRAPSRHSPTVTAVARPGEPLSSLLDVARRPGAHAGLGVAVRRPASVARARRQPVLDGLDPAGQLDERRRGVALEVAQLADAGRSRHRGVPGARVVRSTISRSIAIAGRPRPRARRRRAAGGA